MRIRTGFLALITVVSAIQMVPAAAQETPPAAPSRSYADYSALATEGAWLKSGVAVSGHVGVVEADGLPAAGSSALQIDQGVAVAAESIVAADSVDIASDTNVSVIFANQVSGSLPPGTSAIPFATPLLYPPLVPAAAPGTTPVSIGRNNQMTLSPGAYGTVSVARGATLRLEPGDYQFASLTAGADTAVVPLGAVTATVGGATTLGARAVVGTDTAPLRLVVHGTPTDPLVPLATPSFAAGQGSVIVAEVDVPEGAITIGNTSSVRGALRGRWIQIDRDSVLALGTLPADDQPPTGTIVRPTGARPVFATEEVVITAADDTGVSAVEITVDGVTLGFAGRNAAGDFSIPWDTTLGPDGDHAVGAVVTDAVGNTTTLANVAVTVGNGLGAYD
ncbi:MAG: Ig-like domain-containing protein, partial [Acidimicrobiia bacterium]|nr:Ig-like domain-containing protein [Acidimicrobiia bacterium]